MLQTWPTYEETRFRRSVRHQATAKIGPSAVLQLASAMRNLGLNFLIPPIFADAGIANWLVAPPSDDIEAQRATRAHHALRANLPPAVAAFVLAEAGRLTADELLAHHVPKAVQAALRHLPAALAARLLAEAIKLHGWAFAGAGRVRVSGWRYLMIEIEGNPLCAGENADHPVCAWHAAMFERLFDAVAPGQLRVVEVGCEARGDSACRFIVEPAPSVRPL
ncbi:MAG: bacteriochlorophyll 4-vinyl reductase [Elsteraceae bacterium]